MSHRITTKTEIKDKKLAITALKASGWSYTENGNTLQIHDGPMRRAAINLSTGVISGDTDIHRRDHAGLAALNQGYSEAKFRQEALKQGHQILWRKEEQNGRIRMRCKTHG